jgi:hypothetical protein
MIAMDLAYSLDGVAFARAAGYADLDTWQATLMRSPQQQLILNCSRQAGKSTVSSLLALHTALYRAEALVLLLAPALRQSQELFRKVRHGYASLTYRPTEIAEESALRLEFTNGSRIVCLPGKEQTIRGFSGVSLLVVDEASRVADELYQAVRPMLAVSGGRIILLSTPFGKRGFFHHEWTEGGPDWQRVMIKASDVPRIPRDWLEQERRSIGEWWYQQEYECQFVETTDAVFRHVDIYGAISGDVHPLFGDRDAEFVFSGP